MLTATEGAVAVLALVFLFRCICSLSRRGIRAGSGGGRHVGLSHLREVLKVRQTNSKEQSNGGSSKYQRSSVHAQAFRSEKLRWIAEESTVIMLRRTEYDENRIKVVH